MHEAATSGLGKVRSLYLASLAILNVIFAHSTQGIRGSLCSLCSGPVSTRPTMSSATST